MKKLLKDMINGFKMVFSKQEENRYFVLEELHADGTFKYYICYGTKYHYNVLNVNYYSTKDPAIEFAERLNCQITVRTNIIDV